MGKEEELTTKILFVKHSSPLARGVGDGAFGRRIQIPGSRSSGLSG